MRLRKYLVAASLSLAAATAVHADVTGKVTLTGKAPVMKEIDMSGNKDCAAQHPDPITEEVVVVNAKGELANVVVSVKAEDPSLLGGEVPKTPGVLDQKGCQYFPHVLAVMVGQELQIKNSDAFMHNVHSLPQINPMINFGQPNKDPGKKVDPAKAAEVIKVKCDVHPWMGAWLVVLDHPFFSVSKADGTFAIKGLPDGDYTIKAWHEKFGETEKKVTVKGGNGTVDFAFSAGASAEPVESNIKLVTDTKTIEPCDCETEPAKASAAAPSTQPIQTAMAK
jgi:hypothetical protein